MKSIEIKNEYGEGTLGVTSRARMRTTVGAGSRPGAAINMTNSGWFDGKTRCCFSARQSLRNRYITRSEP